MSDSTSPHPPRRSFIDLYCEQNSLDPGDFDAKVLRQALYPHARFFAPLIRAAWPDHFVADLDFVRSVAHVRRSRDFFTEADAFSHHPANIGFFRHVFRFRISSTRFHRLVRATLHPDATNKDASGEKPTPILRVS